MFWVIAVIAYVIFNVNWTVNMQGRLHYLLLTGCDLGFFFLFSPWLYLSVGMKHIPHTFLSSKLQEHMEIQLRIGATDGFVLIKGTHSYTRKWEKGDVCKYFNRKKSPNPTPKDPHKPYGSEKASWRQTYTHSYFLWKLWTEGAI